MGIEKNFASESRRLDSAYDLKACIRSSREAQQDIVVPTTGAGEYGRTAQDRSWEKWVRPRLHSDADLHVSSHFLASCRQHTVREMGRAETAVGRDAEMAPGRTLRGSSGASGIGFAFLRRKWPRRSHDIQSSSTPFRNDISQPSDISFHHRSALSGRLPYPPTGSHPPASSAGQIPEPWSVPNARKL